MGVLQKTQQETCFLFSTEQPLGMSSTQQSKLRYYDTNNMKTNQIFGFTVTHFAQ